MAACGRHAAVHRHVADERSMPPRPERSQVSRRRSRSRRVGPPRSRPGGSAPTVGPAVSNSISVRSVDLAYLRAHPEQLPTFLTHQRIRETPVHGGSISNASRLTLDDGSVGLRQALAGAGQVRRSDNRDRRPRVDATGRILRGRGGRHRLAPGRRRCGRAGRHHRVAGHTRTGMDRRGKSIRIGRSRLRRLARPDPSRRGAAVRSGLARVHRRAATRQHAGRRTLVAVVRRSAGSGRTCG